MLIRISSTQSSPNNVKSFVKFFPGATVSCMKDYAKPTIRNKKPHKIILHCGTNDLSSPKPPEEIANQIIDLAASLKTDDNLVIVSGIVPRGNELNTKVSEVNTLLSRKLNSRNLGFISHDNIIPQQHLNKSRLHTNISGTRLLIDNIINFCRDY